MPGLDAVAVAVAVDVAARRARRSRARSGRGPTSAHVARRTLSSCGSSSSDVRRRNAPTRVRRSSPSTPPGAVPAARSGTHASARTAPAHRAELEHLELACRRGRRAAGGRRSGRPSEISTRERQREQDRRAADQQHAPATRRSSAYLSANCQPFGSTGRGASSGRPPRCSTSTRLGDLPRTGAGRATTGTPSSSQRRIMPSRTACGAVEKVTTTCSMPCCSIDSLEVPARAEHAAAPSAAVSIERLLVEEADRHAGRAPGCSSRRRATRWPTRPAPTISVGRAASRGVGPRVRPVERDPARSQVDRANASSRTICGGQVVDVPGEGSAADTTVIAASDGRDEDRAKRLEHRQPELPGVHPSPVRRQEDGEAAVTTSQGAGTPTIPTRAASSCDIARPQPAVQRRGPARRGPTSLRPRRLRAADSRRSSSAVREPEAPRRSPIASPQWCFRFSS